MLWPWSLFSGLREPYWLSASSGAHGGAAEARRSTRKLCSPRRQTQESEGLSHHHLTTYTVTQTKRLVSDTSKTQQPQIWSAWRHKAPPSAYQSINRLFVRIAYSTESWQQPSTFHFSSSLAVCCCNNLYVVSWTTLCCCMYSMFLAL